MIAQLPVCANPSGFYKIISLLYGFEAASKASRVSRWGRMVRSWSPTT